MSKKLTAMRSDIIFQFEQTHRHVGDGKAISQAFQESTDWGFEFHKFSETTSEPRWGTVIAVGPECDPDIVVGAKILIDALKWTNHTVHEDQQYWKTSEEFVLGLAIDDEETE